MKQFKILQNETIIFWAVVVCIITSHIYLHNLAVLGNNLYFTIDQGNDSLSVRDIWQNNAIFLKGPETSIRGVFAGPLWYYFLVPGFAFFKGHPLGGVSFLILLNALLLLAIIFWIKKKVGSTQAILVSGMLIFSWTFFETSLYSFNPFPTLTTCFLRMIFLIEFLEGKKKYYYWAVLVTLFTFNFDVAIAAALTFFTYSIGAWGVKRHILSLKEYLVSSFALPGIAIIILAKQFLEVFIKTKVVTHTNSGLGVFSGVNIFGMFVEFLRLIGTVIPRHSILGVFLFTIVVFLFIGQKKKNKYVRDFSVLTFDLTVISFLFFASNRGWRTWHTVYLPPILFIAFLLMVLELPKKIAVPIFLLVLVSKILFFQTTFEKYRTPSSDPSLLYNELSTVDWIYTHAESQGFKVYNYTDRFFDDPYQYLFWWHGLEKYHYLPDEYANYPLAAKELYVPGYQHYLEPKRGADRIAFLIIQSDTNGETNKDWIYKFRDYHDLKEETKVGDIKIEKYYRKPNTPSDFCIWWNRCD